MYLLREIDIKPMVLPDGESGRLSNTAIACLLAVISLAVYVITNCPTIFTFDCGEITMAVATGGVMHPPGYPLYTLIGNMFVRFVPVGEPAYRLGLVSCIFASASVGISYLLVRMVGVSISWSVAAAMGFAFSLNLWTQATKQEPYTLNAFFVTLLLFLALRVNKTGSARLFLILASCVGLSLTNHLTIVFLFPALALLAAPTLYRVHGLRRTVMVSVIAAIVCVISLSPYLLVMLIARNHYGGYINGNPSTLHRLLMHATGVQFQSLLIQPTLSYFIKIDLVFTPSWLWSNMRFMFPAAILGLILMLMDKNRCMFGCALLIGILGYLICYAIYEIPNIYEYYTPIVLLLSIAAGVGCESVINRIAARLRIVQPKRRRRLLFGVAAGIFCIAPLIGNWRQCDRHRADYVRVFGENILNGLPQDAVVFIPDVYELFPVWYAQQVLKERPDIVVMPGPFFYNLSSERNRDLNSWFCEWLHKQHPDIDMTSLIHVLQNSDDTHPGKPLWLAMSYFLADQRKVYVVSTPPSSVFEPMDNSKSLPNVPNAIMVSEGFYKRAVYVWDKPSLKEVIAANAQAEAKMKMQYAPPILFAQEPYYDFTNRFYAAGLSKASTALLAAHHYQDAYNHAQKAYAFHSNASKVLDMVERSSLAVGHWDVYHR